MTRFTVRLDEDDAKWIQQQADERDRSKAWVIEQAVKAARGAGSTYAHRGGAHRSGADRTDAPAGESSDGGTSLRDRVDELEQRLADLESGDVDGGSETAATARRERRHERGEESADPVATGGADGHEAAAGGDDDAGDVPDVIEAAIERAAESWDDDDARTEARKAAAQAVLEALREEPRSRSEIVDEFADEYAVAGQNDDTWWRKNLAECPDAPLKALATYDAGSQQWRWSGAE